MKQIRCPQCGKLLLKVETEGREGRTALELRCFRCKQNIRAEISGNHETTACISPSCVIYY